MTPKKEPIVAVLQYFETAELSGVKIALALAKEIVRRRTPQPKKPEPKRKTTSVADIQTPIN